MGWHKHADPDTDWNDPDAVLHAAISVSRQNPTPAKPDPAREIGECWECGKKETPMYNHGRCAHCAVADYL